MSSVPGRSGIAWIVIGTVVSSALITMVTGIVAHWPFVLVGIGLGLYAIRSMNE